MAGDREGPSVATKRSCFDCRWEKSESYAVQGDSGHDVYCTHPTHPARRFIADTSWDTPEWCPVSRLVTASEPSPARGTGREDEEGCR